MKPITDALRHRRAAPLTPAEAPHRQPARELSSQPAALEIESVLRALHHYRGDDGNFDARTMAAIWRVTPHEDAHLVNPKQALRGSPLYLVRGANVVAVQLTRTTIADAYASLLSRTAADAADQ